MTAHIDFGRSNQHALVRKPVADPEESAGVLAAFLAQPFYVIISNLGPRYGIAGADPTASWDEAIDRWAEHMASDGNCRVVAVSVARGVAADVTSQIERDYLRDLREARMADPEWMEVAP